jgi:hypothetical protein
MSTTSTPRCTPGSRSYYLLMKKKERGELELEKELEEFEEKQRKLMERMLRDKKHSAAELKPRLGEPREAPQSKEPSRDSKHSHAGPWISASSSQEKPASRLSIFPKKPLPAKLELEDIDLPVRPPGPAARSMQSQNKKSVLQNFLVPAAKSKSHKKTSSRLYGVKMYSRLTKIRRKPERHARQPHEHRQQPAPPTALGTPT